MPGAALGGKQSEIVRINLYKRGDCLKVTQFFHVTKERGKNQKGAPEIREETGKPGLTVRLLHTKLRQHSRCREGLLSVQQEGFTSETSKATHAIFQTWQIPLIPGPGTILSVSKAGARPTHCFSSLLGDGWGEGSVWAAGFCHRAFPLQEAYNEFPWHDKDNVLKWSIG